MAVGRGRSGTGTVVEHPEGLVYRAEVLSPDEESELLAILARLDFRQVTMRGQTAKRTVRHYGFDYDYESWQLVPADPLPDFLHEMRDRCAAIAEVAPEDLAQALVSHYPPGAGIGWHRDAPMFGPKVVGVSLASACRMRFQRRVGGDRVVSDLMLDRRSVYVLGGAARSAWQHSIPPTKEERYSITFRTLQNPERWKH
jgi:alkylated DNA repair dioxygenase AlkB